MKDMSFFRCIILLIGVKCIFAYDDLSYGKEATHWRIYNSWSDGYLASNAIDRNTSTCTRTYEIGKGGFLKTTWWKVDLGKVKSIYSVQIDFKKYEGYEMRQRGRFAGFSIYVSNTGAINSSTLCYKDGPLLPPLDFTTACFQHGRYVIFYNERLNEITYPEGYEDYVSYTELCEVIVLGCNLGVYGTDCDMNCPFNCKDQMCDIVNGTCFGCEFGWTGDTCKQECPDGRYGLGCNERCTGYCKHNQSCNHVTGLCDLGCANGYIGAQCNKVCSAGFYGEKCSGVCSPNCTTCRHTDGYCECPAGLMGENCSKECFRSYGKNCAHKCSTHCNGDDCDRLNGSCLTGCKDGYRGEKCDCLYENLQSYPPYQSSLSATSWIVGFSISLVINIILTMLLLHILRFQKKAYVQSNKKTVQLTEGREVLDSNYQELQVAVNWNTYDNLTLQ